MTPPSWLQSAGSTARAGPADGDVHAGDQPPRSAQPHVADHNAPSGQAPHRGQQSPGRRAVQADGGDWGVGGGNPNQDHRVVQAAHPLLGGDGPPAPVVAGAGRVHRRHTGRVDRHRHPRARRWGEQDEKQPERWEDERSDLVRHAPQSGLNSCHRVGAAAPAGHRRAHGISHGDDGRGPEMAATTSGGPVRVRKCRRCIGPPPGIRPERAPITAPASPCPSTPIGTSALRHRS